MTDLLGNTPAKELEELLDFEREKILEGSLEACSNITREKIRLIDHFLKDGPPDGRVVALIRAKASRNQQLLAEVVRALRSVNGRLKAAQSQGKALDTYTKAGLRQQLGSNGSVRFERRT